jgi:hypothetical protein
MITRIFISAVLTGLSWWLLWEQVPIPEAGQRLFIYGLVAAFFGYHRVLLDGDAVPSTRLVIPSEQLMKVRYTLWGMPMGPTRKVTNRQSARQRAERFPRRAAFVEALPVPLRALVRRLGA